MIESAQLIAVLASGIWTGAAIYIGFVEHPSTMKVGHTFATEYFRHMSKRTAPLMMFLSALSGLTACGIWWVSGSTAWFVGGSLQLSMFPLTAIFIVPINIKLIRIDPLTEPGQNAELHKKWGMLHRVRTVLGGMSFPLFTWLL